jgi:hypothetical protein
MKKPATKDEAITPAQYRAFQQAYDFFNAELFAGSLPQRRRRSRYRGQAARDSDGT